MRKLNTVHTEIVPAVTIFFSRLCEVNKRKRLQYGGGYYSHSEKIASQHQAKKINEKYTFRKDRTNSINRRRMFLHLTRLVYNQQNIICLHCTVGQKIKKSPGQKNLWNQINQLDE